MEDNEFTVMFGRAARGDAEAQSFMAKAALEYGGHTPEVALALCDVWSRMAAMQGRWEDLMRVLMCLVITADRRLRAGDVNATVECMAEALLIANRVDEAGEPRAIECLDRLIEAAKEDKVLDRTLDRVRELERELAG